MGQRARPIDPKRFESNRTQYLRQWLIALADRATRPVNLMVLADSIGEGAQSQANTRWVDLVRDELRRRYQPSGVAGGYGYTPARMNISGYTGLVVASGGATTSQATGLGQRAMRLTGSGQKLTLTITATTFCVFAYKDATLGRFKYTVDGGAPTTVDTGATPYGLSMPIDIAAGASGSHTLVLEWVSGIVNIDGVMVFDGDESLGIRTWDASSGGATTAFFVNPTYSVWSYHMGRAEPDLVLIGLGGNDCSLQSPTPEEGVAHRLALYSMIRSRMVTDFAKPAPSIVEIVGYKWPAFSTGYYPVPWNPNYRNSIYSAATQDGNVGIIDLTPRWGERPDLVGLVDDGVHPNDRGHRLYAQAIAESLRP